MALNLSTISSFGSPLCIVRRNAATAVFPADTYTDITLPAWCRRVRVVNTAVAMRLGVNNMKAAPFDFVDAVAIAGISNFWSVAVGIKEDFAVMDYATQQETNKHLFLASIGAAGDVELLLMRNGYG